ncbi:hypothetical protein PGTUg99_011058 [Puccinia graminis f. sp. tritici]|uniref:Uncharacterized protein n=1 Tax=Puccinia graminis f. sp. tritici TaxID=56615 RepID=A0A5B0QQJ4_PUCGR|nr:hypothetical protein PGTUg99_011058 [Puccinia graminis f. sp. tritici]
MVSFPLTSLQIRSHIANQFPEAHARPTFSIAEYSTIADVTNHDGLESEHEHESNGEAALTRGSDDSWESKEDRTKYTTESNTDVTLGSKDTPDSKEYKAEDTSDSEEDFDDTSAADVTLGSDNTESEESKAEDTLDNKEGFDNTSNGDV